LSKAVKSDDVALEATRKYWKKARRKVESECFLDTHRCQWKLGTAHEGQFYGRKRLVLRPRYDATLQSSYEDATSSNTVNNDVEVDISSDQLNKLLTKEYFGYIKDVTKSDLEGNKEDGMSKKAVDGASSHGDIPGTGWGIVDADGSDEGYGVVGLAKENDNNVVSPSQKMEENADISTNQAGAGQSGPDSLNDLLSTEEALNSKKGVLDTGPSHSGALLADNSAKKLETKVVMVSASGNCWGYLSLTDDEIYFRSSYELEDARKSDNAAVNIGKEQRMKRRKWKVSCLSHFCLPSD
jgi:hypothetical protein